jgi:hypothetical protein
MCIIAYYDNYTDCTHFSLCTAVSVCILQVNFVASSALSQAARPMPPAAAAAATIDGNTTTSKANTSVVPVQDTLAHEDDLEAGLRSVDIKVLQTLLLIELRVSLYSKLTLCCSTAFEANDTTLTNCVCIYLLMTQFTQENTNLIQDCTQNSAPTANSAAPSLDNVTADVSGDSVNGCAKTVGTTASAAAALSNPAGCVIPVDKDAAVAVATLDLVNRVDTEGIAKHEQDDNTTATDQQVMCTMHP